MFEKRNYFNLNVFSLIEGRILDFPKKAHEVPPANVWKSHACFFSRFQGFKHNILFLLYCYFKKRKQGLFVVWIFSDFLKASFVQSTLLFKQ